jgi:hypothetical protein
MIDPLLIISFLFAAGGLVTFVIGRRLAGRAPLAWLVQGVGALVLLAGVVGAIAELFL